MDRNIQEAIQNKRDELLKRETDRKFLVEKRKEEKDVSVRDQMDFFSEAFTKKHYEIEDGLRLIEEGEIEKKHLPDHFEKWCKETQILNKFLSVSTYFLNNYTIRKCIEKINCLEMKLKELEETLLPKKKFGFKSRKTPKYQTGKKLISEVDGNLKKVFCYSEIISSGFSEKKNEKLSLDNEDILKKDVEISKLEDCTVTLFGNPSTMHITNVSRCKIFCGPVSTSVFVENCDDCTFVFACQQLRIHSTHNCSFYIHVTSRAIIEDTDHVGFAPFNWKYDDLDKHYEESGLDLNRNNWSSVDDFNWLANDVPSPNWRVIDDHERTEEWKI